MTRKTWGFASFGLFGMLFISSCLGGTASVGTEDPETDGGAGSGSDPGKGECEPGAMKPAGDSCNTCTCSDEETWICTRTACDVCTPGATRAAGDGCNTCTCLADRRWACTMIFCSCEPGSLIPAGDGCNFCTCDENGVPGECTLLDCNVCPAPQQGGEDCPPVTVYAKSPDHGDCCFYSDPCRAPEEWEQYPTLDECMADDVTCPPGFVSCDGDRANGCEIDISSDVQNCGGCALVCPTSDNSLPVCITGVCEIVCDAGFSDCNADIYDGCETPGTCGE